MLSPERYRADCETMVGTMIDHKYCKPEEEKALFDRTKHLWEKEYKHEPFFVKCDKKSSSCAANIDLHTTRIACNFREEAKMQRYLYYQMTLPHYRCKVFLEAAVRRYKKYLHIRVQNSTVGSAPSYDIGLMTNAHKCHPVTYVNDMSTIFGDAEQQGKCGNAMPSQGDASARQLWLDLFGKDVSIPGTLYRGSPSLGRIVPERPHKIRSVRTNVFQVCVNELSILGVSNKHHNYIIRFHKCPRNVTSSLKQEAVLVKQLRRSPYSATNESIIFDFDSSIYDSLSLSIETEVGTLCCTQMVLLGQCQIPFLCDGGTSHTETRKVNHTCHLNQPGLEPQPIGVDVKSSALVSPGNPGPCLLTLRLGEYESDCGGDLASWGPVYLPQYAADMPVTRIMATH